MPLLAKQKLKPKKETNKVKVKPILFNTEMVGLLLDGSKTQTRRPISNALMANAHTDKNDSSHVILEDQDGFPYHVKEKCPFGKVGDLLWVRETFIDEADGGLIYRAGGVKSSSEKWTPSIHMPKGLSRITLEVTDIKVERISDITTDDLIKEGFGGLLGGLRYHDLLLGMYGHARLHKNPHVWVIEFKVHMCNFSDFKEHPEAEFLDQYKSEFIDDLKHTRGM